MPMPMPMPMPVPMPVHNAACCRLQAAGCMRAHMCMRACQSANMKPHPHASSTRVSMPMREHVIMHARPCVHAAAQAWLLVCLHACIQICRHADMPHATMRACVSVCAQSRKLTNKQPHNHDSAIARTYRNHARPKERNYASKRPY
jgi:hypothetical protein